MQDAIRADRYLTILSRLTGADLLRELWPVVLRVAWLIFRFRRGEKSPEAAFAFEVELQSLLREVGRLIVQWSWNRLEPDDNHWQEMPRLFAWDGQFYRRRKKSPLRNLSCLFGPITLLRFCYQPLETCGRCLFPLEIQLGIVSGVATPALADSVCRMAADLTQRQTLERLRLQHGVGWGVPTVRKVIAAVSESMGEHRHEAQVQCVLGWLKKAAARTGPRRFVLSVGRDGVMIPVVGQQTYKEAAAATVSVMDRWGRRLGTVYLGQMPESHQVTLGAELTRLLTDILSQWEGSMPRLVYVTDCGHHPTEFFEQVLSTMKNPRRPQETLEWGWIVDYYHACQYITRIGEAIFGPGREAFAWAAKQRRVLKEKPAGIFRVLRSAGALRVTRGLVGTEESYSTAYAFLRGRAGKMDYRNYRHLQLPIGSGITEAACKVLFTQRFKQSGMKWGAEGGRAILRLRVIACSRLWDPVRRARLRSSPLPIPVTERSSNKENPENLRKLAV